MDVPLIREEKKENSVHSGQKEFSEGFLKIISEKLETHHRGNLRLTIPVTVELNKSEQEAATKVRDLYLAIAKEQMEIFKPVNPKETHFSYDIQCVAHPFNPRSLQVNLSFIVLMKIHPKRL